MHWLAEWNVYPKTKPEHKGIYIVTVQGRSEALMMSYSPTTWEAEGVIAWMDKPPIYEG